MKKAIIDLGTNTFNLIIGSVARNRLEVFYATKEAVMLGMGGINEGIIAKDAMTRAKETLTRFRKICMEGQVDTILGIGTAAMRDAQNSSELIDWAERELGFEIRIVSGEDEAELIYRGVSLLHPFNEPGMIMDIGGGSNEFIYADKNQVIEAKSFNIGVSRIYQLLDQPEVFTSEIQVKVDQFFEEQTRGFFDDRNVPHLIGASGSFETFYEMLHKERFPDDQQLKEIPVSEIRKLIDWSLKASLEERMQNEWIVPMRKKMLPIAAYSILWVMDKLKTERLTICPYSLKEGAFVM
ncbi:MAG: hypothetical protein Crog4KO_13060 [Crocinitomicaceae bacterium]